MEPRQVQILIDGTEVFNATSEIVEFDLRRDVNPVPQTDDESYEGTTYEPGLVHCTISVENGTETKKAEPSQTASIAEMPVRDIVEALHERLKEGNDALIDQIINELVDYNLLKIMVNSPMLKPFLQAAENEAAHQRQRWGDDHDKSKQPVDWFWTLGHLAGKAATAETTGDMEKALHHTISSAALLANWHRSILEKTNETDR